MPVMTKKALAMSLLELLEEKSMDEITIIDIVSHQGVNRQTFYYHYKSLNDLVEHLFSMVTKNLVGENRTYKTWQKGYESIFNFVLQHKNVVNNVFSSRSSAHLDRTLFDTTFAFLYNVIEELATERNIEVSSEDKTYIGRLYSYIFVGIINDWIDDGMKEKPKKIIAKLNSFIEGDFLRKLELLSRESSKEE